LHVLQLTVSTKISIAFSPFKIWQQDPLF